MAINSSDFSVSRYQGSDADMVMWAGCPSFTTTSARDTFYSSYSNQLRNGQTAWTDGAMWTWTYYNGQWLPERGALVASVSQTSSSNVDAGSTTSGTVITNMSTYGRNYGSWFSSNAFTPLVAGWYLCGGGVGFAWTGGSSTVITDTVGSATSVDSTPQSGSATSGGSGTTIANHTHSYGHTHSHSHSYMHSHSVPVDVADGGARLAWLTKNGTGVLGSGQGMRANVGAATLVGVRSAPVYLNGATDYVQLVGGSGASSAVATLASATHSGTTFWAQFIGA